MQIIDGKYTVVFADGKHITFCVETHKDGDFEGKTVISYLTRIDNNLFYKKFAFVNGKFVNLWKKFRASHTKGFIEKLEEAIRILQSDIYRAGKNYALKTGKCFICFRELTNPESIEAGIGPYCRKRLMM